jgi:hypothetical protein
LRSGDPVAGAVFQVHRRPPPLYRLARALRRMAVVVLVLLILFTASVVYSAAETARSSSQLSNVSASFEGNGTLLLSSTLTLSNQGIYPIEGLHLGLRVTNASGTFLGAVGFGPSTLASQATTSYALSFFVPVGATGPGPSLLTEDQTLPVRIWANATVGYLFPVALTLSDNRSWGAPFADLHFSVGAPTMQGGTVAVPVDLSFEDHAPLADAGTLQFAILSSRGLTCGSGSFPINVPSESPYNQTTTVTLASGCSPSGGEVTSEYVTPSYTVVLPPEALP